MRIQTTFARLITRLLVVYNGEPFELLPSIQPVSIVDQDVALSAIATPQTLATPFTEGDVAAPAADTVLADTLAQVAGEYVATIMIFTNDASNSFLIQRRNAANTDNIWRFRLRWADTGKPMVPFTLRVRLETNERLRIVNENIAVAATTYNAHIWLTQVA